MVIKFPVWADENKGKLIKGKFKSFIKPSVYSVLKNRVGAQSYF